MPAIPRPEFALQTTDGVPFRFRARTAGTLTVLLFGYTACPDVCPLELAALGRVMDHLPSPVREQVRVVFVTTDPARDTPTRLAAYVRGFHPAFVALTGSDTAVAQALAAAGAAPASRFRNGADSLPPAPGDTAYTVLHVATMFVYTPDDSLHVTYPPATRSDEWAHELPRLAATYRAGR